MRPETAFKLYKQFGNYEDVLIEIKKKNKANFLSIEQIKDLIAIGKQREKELEEYINGKQENIRESLQKINQVRDTFKGTFERFGEKENYHGYSEKTVLLKDIKDKEDNLVCDHLWFNFTKGFEKLEELKKGDTIQFDARIKEYTKGYVNRRQWINERCLDYKLSHPSKIKFVNKEELENEQ